jgi:hypothetical protein
MFKIRISLLCIISILSFFPVIGNARTLACPFNDNFSLDGPVNTHILNSSVQGNLNFTQSNATFFSLSCGNDKYSSGDLFITIGINGWHQCNLTIHDGPFELNPYVSFVSCKGILKYDGMDHVRGSYDYTLKFSYTS